MGNRRTTSEQEREAAKIGAALKGAAALMVEGSRFSVAIHGLPVEVFTDRRIQLDGVLRNKTETTLFGRYVLGEAEIPVYSAGIPLTPEPEPEPES